MEEIKQEYTRVTEILSLYNNFDAIRPEVLQHAADRGTSVHNYCACIARDEYFPDPDEEASPYIQSFREWFEKMVDKVELVEKRLYNDDLMLTGAIDLVCTIRGSSTPVVVDIKTPQAKSRSWNLQLAAYRYLYGENEDPRRIALQLQKTGKIAKIVEYRDHERDWKLYLSALQLYRYFN